MENKKNLPIIAFVTLIVWLVCPAVVWSSASLEQAVSALPKAKLNAKAALVEQIATLGDERALPILQALLKANLYYRKADKVVVIAVQQDDQFHLTDALNGQALGAVNKRELKKIGINNKLRNVLKGAIARLNLTASEASKRLAAVQLMLGDASAETTSLLASALQTETNKKVKAAIATALALAATYDEKVQNRLAAVEQLSGELDPEVRNRLVAMTNSETDPPVAAAVQLALQGIESKVTFYGWVEKAFFGLSLGSVLLLAAIGLAITFGVMGVINMAHGELIMLGAYTTYLVQLAMPNYIDLSVLVAIPAAFVVSGLFGIAIERGVIRHLYGRPLETLLATFGISLILQQLVRTAISAQNVAVDNPSWMSGFWQVNAALSITYNRLYILIFALLVFAGLLLILKKTALGLQVRAVSQNRAMARAMGIRSERVDALTFGLGSGIAGVAGVALSQLTNVGPNMGQSYIIDSFMVVVFGGVGNLWGTLVGAMSLGVANKFLEPYSGAVLAKIFVLIFIILFIQKRPRGLFPQKGRMAEN